jgi:hypothetical protein
VKAILLGLAGVVGLAGFSASEASAAWVYQTRYRWDPVCGHPVAYRQRVWVPDVCDPVGPYPHDHHRRHDHGRPHHRHDDWRTRDGYRPYN